MKELIEGFALLAITVGGLLLIGGLGTVYTGVTSGTKFDWEIGLVMAVYGVFSALFGIHLWQTEHRRKSPDGATLIQPAAAYPWEELAMNTSDAMMTAEQFLALPDRDIDRELIRGSLREKPKAFHSRSHGATEANLIGLLGGWLHRQSPPHGELYGGEVGCILRRHPDTLVGIDVAYFAAEQMARQPREVPWLEVCPTRAIEIREATDPDNEIMDKVREYLLAGVPLVWIVDPRYRTVRVHRPGAEPELFNATQEISAEPHLPGFRVPVAAIFE